jgi:transposase-like protein
MRKPRLTEAQKMEIANSPLSVNKLALKYKKHPTQIYRWRKKYRNSPQAPSKTDVFFRPSVEEVEGLDIDKAIDHFVLSIQAEILRQVRLKLLKVMNDMGGAESGVYTADDRRLREPRVGP